MDAEQIQQWPNNLKNIKNEQDNSSFGVPQDDKHSEKATLTQFVILRYPEGTIALNI